MAINPDFGGNVTDDSVVNEVIDTVLKRHRQGMEKFGKTMEENERPFDQWIEELVEELLDAVHYAIKAKKIIEKFKAKNQTLEKMLATFKEETFKAVTEQTLPPGTQPGGADWDGGPKPDEDWDNPPERDPASVQKNTDTELKDKVSSDNWYEAQRVEPPPKGNPKNENKKEDKT